METLLSRCERDRRLRFMLSPTDCTQAQACVPARRVERGQRGQRRALGIEKFVRCASDRQKLCAAQAGGRFFFIAFGEKRQPSQISQLNTNTRKWPLPLLAERVSTTTSRSFTVAPPTAETIASQRVRSGS